MTPGGALRTENYSIASAGPVMRAHFGCAIHICGFRLVHALLQSDLFARRRIL
jgi:hypothetical protein